MNSMDSITVLCATTDELINAVNSARDGEVIGVGDGEYDLSGKRGLAFNDKHHVTIRSVSGNADAVIFKGGGFHKQNGYSNTPRDILTEIQSGSSYITIHGITFRDSNAYGIKVNGEDNVSHITIDGCKFIDINERMIKGSMGTEGYRVAGVRIMNNYFEDTMLPFESDHMDVFEGNYISAIDMMVLDDAVVCNNTFVNIKGKHGEGRGAIFIWGLSKNVIVEKNVIINCNRGICFGNPGNISVPTGNDAFFVDGGSIRDNVIIGTTLHGIELAYTNNINVSNNVVYCSDATQSGIEETSKSMDRQSTGLTVSHNTVRAFIKARDAAIDKNHRII